MPDQPRPRTVPAPPATDAVTPPAVRVSPLDTGAVLGGVLLPSMAIGVIKRRPRLMRLAQRTRLDRMSNALPHRMRHRNGPGPLVLPLHTAEADRILANTETFHPGGHLKRLSLRHLQPHGVLISDEPDRSRRHELTEDVLEPDRPSHSLAATMTAVIRDEASVLLTGRDRLGWTECNDAWWRIVRRIVLGDGARDDDQLTDLLDRLRKGANWALPWPAATGSATGSKPRCAGTWIGPSRAAWPGSWPAPAPSRRRPRRPGPHWLFAFDAAGMATYRAPCSPPIPSRPPRVRAEPGPSPYARACVLDTVRLWPTTPLLLREAPATPTGARSRSLAAPSS